MSPSLLPCAGMLSEWGFCHESVEYKAGVPGTYDARMGCELMDHLLRTASLLTHEGSAGQDLAAASWHTRHAPSLKRRYTWHPGNIKGQ